MGNDATDAGIIDQHIETTPSGDGVSQKSDPISVHSQVSLNICGFSECVSAWKSDPVCGVIGVQN
jgi:hypothetical protein